MRTMNRWEQPLRGATTLQEQINRVFGDRVGHTSEESNLTPWAPPVDIYETEHELVVKADLPEVNPQDLDIHVENNILTIRGERKFENKVNEEDYLRVERTYGPFSRSFSLANSVKSEAIKAAYKNGVLTLSIPKREEAKPKQIKVNVESPEIAMAAGGGRDLRFTAGSSNMKGPALALALSFRPTPQTLVTVASAKNGGRHHAAI